MGLIARKIATFEEAEAPNERLKLMIDLIYPEGGDAASE
jgi:hypothetical protein